MPGFFDRLGNAYRGVVDGFNRATEGAQPIFKNDEQQRPAVTKAGGIVARDVTYVHAVEGVHSFVTQAFQTLAASFGPLGSIAAKIVAPFFTAKAIEKLSTTVQDTTHKTIESGGKWLAGKIFKVEANQAQGAATAATVPAALALPAPRVVEVRNNGREIPLQRVPVNAALPQQAAQAQQARQAHAVAVIPNQNQQAANAESALGIAGECAKQAALINGTPLVYAAMTSAAKGLATVAAVNPALVSAVAFVATPIVVVQTMPYVSQAAGHGAQIVADYATEKAKNAAQYAVNQAQAGAGYVVGKVQNAAQRANEHFFNQNAPITNDWLEATRSGDQDNDADVNEIVIDIEETVARAQDAAEDLEQTIADIDELQNAAIPQELPNQDEDRPLEV